MRKVVSCLSEVVMYAAELLDDEAREIRKPSVFFQCVWFQDARVESAVRAMVKTIEDQVHFCATCAFRTALIMDPSLFGVDPCRTARVKACMKLCRRRSECQVRYSRSGMYKVTLFCVTKRGDAKTVRTAKRCCPMQLVVPTQVVEETKSGTDRKGLRGR